LSLGLCMSGVIAITGLDPAGSLPAVLVVLLAVVLMVLRDLATRKTDPSVPSLTIALVSTLAVPVLNLPLSGVADWSIPGPLQAGLLAGTALCVGGGTLLLIIAMRITTLSRIAPFRYSAMVFAVIVGAVVWREIPDAGVLLGVALILIGGTLGAGAARTAPAT